MGRSVAKLDYSSWTPEQLARKQKLDFRHPLRGVLDGVSQEVVDETQKGCIRMAARDYGNGLKECVVWRHQPKLEDVELTLQRAIERDMGDRAERGEGDRDASIKRAVRRAKQDVRRKCKTLGVNSLWTLTYRENVEDRAVALKHLKEFRRRAVAVLGEWRYVAVLQRQERGAWHIHLATHKLQRKIDRKGVKVDSWRVMRAIWRSVVGSLGGNFDEAKRATKWGKGAHRSFRSSGAIAGYIAGYVARDMEESGLNEKRYSASKGIDIPDAVREQFRHDEDMAGLIELAYAAVGDRITRTWYCAVSGVFFIESDDTPTG